MKVKVDENLPREVADLFRKAGHDTATVEEEGLSGKSDTVVASFVKREERLFVTLDLDFSDMRVYPPEQYGGLVVLRLNRENRVRIRS